MKMVRMLIRALRPLKAKLDAERHRGSASGLIRHLLEQDFKRKKAA